MLSGIEWYGMLAWLGGCNIDQVSRVLEWEIDLRNFKDLKL